ncbi:MAG: PilC/PilY family type IV pilus protein [Comamonadaceae bacterium]|nr:PilC/PilY family type IV pilus protein [Comamonadaceae bacterium]
MRGDATNEDHLGNPYRKRTFGTTRNVLGDIVNSSPFFVVAPEAGYRFGNYQTFADARSNRRPMIYIGANDGMLHGFDANTGLEVFTR